MEVGSYWIRSPSSLVSAMVDVVDQIDSKTGVDKIDWC
jgi:hypothetical protein